MHGSRINGPADWIGFQLERRDETTKQVTVLVNRIPPKPGQGPVQPTGISSAQSPIRRCIWTDHSVVGTDNVSYRVTAMKGPTDGPFTPDAASASGWSVPQLVSGDAGGGLQAYFNRGTLMSQIVSRFVNGDVSDASLRGFLKNLATPGFQARLYLAGDALREILAFLRDADRRGSTIHAAIYEMNDHELVDALKPFGSRGHVLLGNGGATQPWVAQELAAASLEVKHRDLSHHGRSSPSVHNKFVVESDAAGKNASRVLTGSTNWTTTGLCTQLNNVLIIEDTVIAARYLDQWGKLVADGDDMPAALKASNSTPTTTTTSRSISPRPSRSRIQARARVDRRRPGRRAVSDVHAGPVAAAQCAARSGAEKRHLRSRRGLQRHPVEERRYHQGGRRGREVRRPAAIVP